VLLQHALDNESTDLINSMINDTRALGHDERFKIFSPLSKEHWLTNINGKEDFWEIYKNANINNDEIAKIFSAVIKEDWPTLYHIVGIKDFCKIYNKAKLMGLSPSEQDDRLKHLKQLLQEFKLTECRLIKRKTKLPRGVVGEIAKYF
jgi:hypothetical protein